MIDVLLDRVNDVLVECNVTRQQRQGILNLLNSKATEPVAPDVITALLDASGDYWNDDWEWELVESSQGSLLFIVDGGEFSYELDGHPDIDVIFESANDELDADEQAGLESKIAQLIQFYKCADKTPETAAAVCKLAGPLFDHFGVSIEQGYKIFKDGSVEGITLNETEEPSPFGNNEF